MEQVQSIVVPTPNTQDPKDPLQTSRGHHNWATGVNVCLQLMTIDDYFCKQKKMLQKYWDLHTSFFRVSCTYMSSVSIWGGEGCSLRVAAVTNNCDLFQSISLKLLTKKILDDKWTRTECGIIHLAIKFGVFIEGVVELLGTLLQSQWKGGLGTCCPRPVFKVPFFKQGPQILHWMQNNMQRILG